MKQQYTIKDFLPLIIISGVVLLAASGVSIVRDQLSVQEWMGNFMGVFFLVFGGFKAVNVQGFAKAYQEYDLLAKKSKTYAYVYPFLEIALGILYITATALFWTHSITAVLMLFSAAGVYNELQKKKQITCACLGVLFKIPMTWVTLVEDVLMAGLAIYMLVI